MSRKSYFEGDLFVIFQISWEFNANLRWRYTLTSKMLENISPLNNNVLRTDSNVHSFI